MNERIGQLEKSVKRWRRLSLCLALLLVLVLAVGGTLTVIPATGERSDFWSWLPWVRAARERAVLEEMRARKNAVRALRAADAEKRAVDP